MKKLIAVFAILGLSTIALADEAPPATEVAPEPEVEQVDCTELEGDEKVACEEAAPEAPPEAAKAGKGGLTKSEDGRMESFDEDE
jgi:hypothetical protein